MALSKIDVANMLTGATPVANGGTALTSGFVNGSDPRPDAKPLIINGDMQVSQRGTSFTSNGYTVDRFTFDESSDGAVTVTQDTTVPSGQGFAKSVKFDVTTADGTLASNQYCQWTQFIEGQNLQLLKYGTSSAENLTLAFWVRSNKTGTYGVRFVKEAGGQTRYECPITYTISSADTWEKKVINLSPTAGSTTLITNSAGAIVNSNASGFRIAWILAAGSDYHATNNTWVAASDKFTTSSQTNLLDNTSNELYITGIQLEVGEFSSTTLPPFQHEDFGDNKQRCARYYYKVAEYGADGLTNQTFGMGYYKHTDQWRILCYLPERPRTNPSLDSTSGTNYYINDIQGVDDTFNSVTLTRSNADIIQVVHNNSNVSGTTGEAGESVAVASGAYIAFDAEL